MRFSTSWTARCSVSSSWAEERAAGLPRCVGRDAERSLVHPREVLKALILANAAACVLVHNHPSGVATPSAEEFVITERLCRVAAELGVRVLDHIVIGAVTHYSLADQGTLPAV